MSVYNFAYIEWYEFVLVIIAAIVLFKIDLKMNALNEAEVTFPALNSCCYQRKDSSHRSLTSDSTNRHSGDHFKSHFG